MQIFGLKNHPILAKSGISICSCENFFVPLQRKIKTTVAYRR